MMAEDSTLADDVSDRIGTGTTAERAVFEGFAVFRDMLIDLGGYMGERATDLDDVAQRVIAALAGRPAPGVPESDTPYILVAHDLAPADTALLDLSKVLGLVTREGGPTSHTAILAREKAIVAVVGVAGADALTNGTEVIVDAAAGVVTVAPTDAQRAEAQRRIDERAAALAGALGCRRSRRRHADPPARQPRFARRDAEGPRRRGGGRRAVPHRVPLPGCADGADGRAAAGAVHPAARRLPRQEGRRAGARRRRRQAPRVPERRARGQPGARPARHPGAPRQRGHPARAADGARRGGCGHRRRPVGHGSHGGDRGGDALLRRARHRVRPEDGRRHGRGPVGRADRRPHPARGGVRIHRHQRPDPVHAGRRPAARVGRRAAGPVASGGAPPHRRGRPRPAARTASPSGSAGRRPRIPCSPPSWSASASPRSPCRRPPSRTCGSRSRRFTLDQARQLAGVALAADGAAEARDAVRTAIAGWTTPTTERNEAQK